MDSQGLKEAVTQALRDRGNGSSRATIYREAKKTRAKYPGATSEQAWLLLAHDLGIPIAEYEDDGKQLADVGELRKRWGTQTASEPSTLRTESKAPPRTQNKRAARERFDFVSSPHMRRICLRDYEELAKVRHAQAHKSTIILAGGLLEALLSDALSQEPANARASYRRLYPNKKRVNWTLECLIDVAADMGTITPGATQLSHTLRDYRNLVHPRKEITSGYKVRKEEAEIAVNMVHIVMRDLKNL
jgi:hypothetical protein